LKHEADIIISRKLNAGFRYHIIFGIITKQGKSGEHFLKSRFQNLSVLFRCTGFEYGTLRFDKTGRVETGALIKLGQ